MSRKSYGSLPKAEIWPGSAHDFVPNVKAD